MDLHLSVGMDTHSLPLRSLPHSSPSKLDHPPSPSLYVTLKVFQLVNTFRQRAETRGRHDRVLKKATSKRTNKGFCASFERQAFEEIDKYLGRKTTVRRIRKRAYPSYEGGVGGKDTRKATRYREAVVATDTEDNRVPGRGIQWLLDELDRAVTSKVTKVAKDHALFVQRSSEFDIKLLSLKELTQLLVVVKDLLSSLRRATSSNASVRTLAEGNELLDLHLDEGTTANLEHLLLCLKDQLLRLLVEKLVEVVRKQVLEGQENETRNSDDLLLEFPNAKHPLSTTWPWNIKPSLVVLWGVCWMFYNFNWELYYQYWLLTNAGQMGQPPQETPQGGQQGGQQGQDGQRQQRRPRQQQQQQQQNGLQNGQLNGVPNGQLNGQQQMYYNQGAPPQHTGHTGIATSAPASLSPFANYQQPYNTQNTTSGDSLAAWSPPTYHTTAHQQQQQHMQYQHHQRPLTSASFAQPRGYALATAHGNSGQRAHDLAALLPEDGGPTSRAQLQPSGFTHANANAYSTAPAGDASAWSQPPSRQQQQQHLFGHADASWPSTYAAVPALVGLPLGARAHAGPRLSIIPPHPPLQPQDAHNNPAFLSAISSAVSSATESTLSFHDALPNNPFDPTHLSPQHARFRQPHMSHDENAQHPLPPESSPERLVAAALSEQFAQAEQSTRKRSHDDMNGVAGDGQHAPDYAGHSREGSASSHYLPSGEEAPARTRTIKRPEAPTNQHGKYICQYSEGCQDVTFDRKCEWSKHMDKHDRPYRCQNPECAKLQGFTYSGGLLRHEREVHNKHGGPKATLVCPFPDCKRNTGKGFTRKENLNEHVRRVHETNKDGTTQSQSQAIKQPGDAVNGADDIDTPYYPTDQASPMRKRRRFTQGTTSERSGSEDGEDLRGEVQRLRQQADTKDAQMAEMQEQIRQLKALVQQQHPQPPVPQEQV